MNWIKQNKKKIAAIVAAVIALFVTISDITSNTKVDAIADKLEPLGNKIEQWANETNSITTNTP